MPQDRRHKFQINLRDIDNIECDIDIAIISSTALSRAMLTKTLLSNTKVKNIIFEKFLFQNRADYKEIQDLLKFKKINAWVNQWMSSSLAFNEMNNWFGNDLQEIKIDGRNWGMCCNSVHYLEYFDYISSRQGLLISNSNIDSKVLNSKRNNYFELTGTLTVKSKSGMKMILTSQNLKNDGVVNISMRGKSKTLDASFSGNTIKCKYYDELAGENCKQYEIPFHSQTTGNIVEEIFYNESCSLPTFNQSVRQHLILFDCFKIIFKQQLQLINKCPIT
ncbi:hypothetical protein N8Z61_02845 [Candidatus Thioglobus sp.]|nr:hypothetical protein [Candidatus Thioglobus sp.]